MNIRLFAKRIWRILRQVPRRAARDWVNAFWNEGNIIAFLTAAFSSYLAIRTANLPALFDEAGQWISACTALLYVSAGWAAVCVCRAPIVLFLEEKRDGTWFNGRYVLHRPMEVFQVRARATGKPEFYRFYAHFAEPKSFLYFNITCDRDIPRALYTAQVVSGLLMLPLKPGGGCVNGGTRLGPNREARLMVIMQPETVSQTFRVFCSEFEFDEPDEHHGKVGDANLPWLEKRMAEEEAQLRDKPVTD